MQPKSVRGRRIVAEETQAAGIGPILGAAGACPTITHKGKEWSVGWPTQKAKTELEMLVINTVKKNLDDAKIAYTPAEFEEEKAILRSLIRGGQFKTWGTLWKDVCQGTEQFPLYIYCLVKTKHPEFTYAMMSEIWNEQPEDCLDAFSVVMPDFFMILVSGLPNILGLSPAEIRAEMMGSMVDLRQQLLSLKNIKSTPSPS